MIDAEQKAHDLTIALVWKTCSESTPEAYVKAYCKLLPQVKAAISAEHSSAKGIGEVKVTPRPF